MAEKVLGVENLRLKFPGASTLLFKDLSISIAKGEKVLFLGPSGCGKSTLLQVLSGIIPHSLDVPVKAEDIYLSESWGYLFQDPDTQFCMPFVDEEMAFVLENLGVPRAQMLPRIHELLKLVGLSFEDAHVPIQSLSQGMKQRLALASVLALEPQVLLFDEPTALLDPAGTLQIWDTIKRLTCDKTVVIVEHKINEIVDYVDRVVLFGPDGRILADGPAEQIFEEYKQALIQFGIWYPEVWEDYIRTKHKQQGQRETGVHAVNSDRASVSVSASTSTSTSTSSISSAQDILPMQSTVTNSETNVQSQAVIKLEDFKGYRGAECKIHVPTASINRQDWIAITGENGAGKSTFLLALMQLLKTTGSYQLNGRDITYPRDSVAKELAYVFQNPEFQFVTNSVFEEIAYSLKVLHVPKEQIERKVREMLASFELLGHEQQHPYQLSIGQKRRLSVASALVQEQSILLLDEPTFGQDAKNTFAMLEQLERLRKAGTTILMITHDEEIVRYFATRVWEIDNGMLVRDVPQNQELSSPLASSDSSTDQLLEEKQAPVLTHHGNLKGQVDPKDQFESLDQSDQAKETKEAKQTNEAKQTQQTQQAKQTKYANQAKQREEEAVWH